MAKCLYIEPELARELVLGRKISIFKRRYLRSLINTDMVAVTNINNRNFAIGKIRLKTPLDISAKSFRQLRHEHCMSDDDRRENWPGAQHLYCYDIVRFDKSSQPAAINLAGQNELCGAELKDYIRNIDSYDPRTVPAKVLADDWRIACAWYSSLLAGRPLKYTKEAVIAIARKIHSEMARRRFQFHPEKMSAGAEALYANVSGHEMSSLVINSGCESDRGSMIYLEDFVNKWDSFIVCEDIISVVGSLANFGKTDGDIDIVIRANGESELFHTIKWRISRAYPEYDGRLHFLSDKDSPIRSPFTSHVSLGNLAVRPVSEQQVHETGDMTVHEMAKEPGWQAAAERSKSANEIVPFRPFYMPKPMHGRKKEEHYSIDTVLDVMNSSWA